MVQPNFQAQKCEIEEFITFSTDEKYHKRIYYLEYHCELNQIEYFWYNAKKWAQKNYQYTIKDLQQGVFQALASMPHNTFDLLLLLSLKNRSLLKSSFI